MRKVGIKQFQKNIYKELADSPFIITKNGKYFRTVIDEGVATSPKESANTNPSATTYTVSNKPLGLDHLPEDGSNLTVEGIPHNKPEALQEDVTIQDARPTGKCQIPNGICRNLGYKYKIAFYDSEGLVKKDLFLCDLHVKKAKEQDMEVQEV
jgi:hypothetical protein